MGNDRQFHLSKNFFASEGIYIITLIQKITVDWLRYWSTMMEESSGKIFQCLKKHSTVKKLEF